MEFKPNYIPKNKRKVNYKIVVPFVVLAAVLFYFGIQKFMPKLDEDRSYAICNLNSNDSRNLIKSREYSADILMKDYGVYGESLGLYHEEVKAGVSDEFSGKTFFLNNLCHEDERAYMMDVSLDRKLPIAELDDGFYELEVLDGLDRFFLMSEEKVDETFYGINRNGFRKQVNVIADKSIFYENDESIHDKNYVYLEVKTVENKEMVDVVIDPARLNELWEGYIDYGSSRDGVSESEITYRIAEKLQKELEATGLRTEVLREKDEPRDFLGTNGRAQEAYDLKAKYYINLAFPSSGATHDQGVTVIYSSYSSNKLASDVMNHLRKGSSVVPSTWTGSNDIDGVYPTYRDGHYDRKLEIREVGGKFTLAGQLEENKSGKENRNGMQGITIELGYMSDEKDYKTVVNEEDKIVAAIVEAMKKYLRI
ncbi:N-acetylmuramoyl-L-alanine amidase [Erysipelothrix urinaevulpis]|uniref:N-acetylmuramoyl-L-alanine amidase family protein n=1 Tax=Erysipelothrix urinaevulpis TaxID=2683717 RepID=UPI00135783D5|nr:N-acetylmuramoyl-L-alanine amidase [Erysipelothrix urinaevulpis]